jgi:hypothetical protein
MAVRRPGITAPQGHTADRPGLTLTVDGEGPDTQAAEDGGALLESNLDVDQRTVDVHGGVVARRGQVVMDTPLRLCPVHHHAAASSESVEVNRLRPGARRRFGFVEGAAVSCQGEAAVEDQARHREQRDGENHDERGGRPSLVAHDAMPR